MFEPTLVAKWGPPPQVKVTFDDLDPATSTVTVWRQADVLLPVPGTQRVFAAGGVTVDDLWAPHSVQVTYWAEMFDADGVSLGNTGSASATVWGPRGSVVFSDPYDPMNCVVVDADVSFGAALASKRESAIYNVGGGSVGLLGAKGLLQDVDLSVKADTAEQLAGLVSVLGQTLVLVRLAPGVRPGFPTLMYVIADFSVQDADHMGGYQFGGESSVWRVTGNQVSAITVGSAEAAYPWQVYDDAFTTWADMASAYPTWLDAKKNPPGA